MDLTSKGGWHLPEPCRYGLQCKRRGCWYSHPSPAVELSASQDGEMNACVTDNAPTMEADFVAVAADVTATPAAPTAPASTLASRPALPRAWGERTCLVRQSGCMVLTLCPGAAGQKVDAQGETEWITPDNYKAAQAVVASCQEACTWLSVRPRTNSQAHVTPTLVVCNPGHRQQ
jgi:hypothetical protein